MTTLHGRATASATRVRRAALLGALLATGLIGEFAVAATAQASTGRRPAAPHAICVGDPANCVSAEASAPRIKWHPGHYLISDTIGRLPESHVRALAAEPLLTGVRQRYWWATLEPRRGQYDFSVIEADLARLRRIGKRLVITVADRSWDGAAATGRLPDYLAQDAAYGGGWFVKPNGMGVIARVWDPTVMDRILALYAALGARFDAEPDVEGVVLGETSPGFNASPSGYSRGTLAAQLKRQVSAVRAAWPTSNVFLYTNSLVGELAGLIEHCTVNRVGIGGPDVLPPPHKGILGDRLLMGTEPGATRDYRGQTPIGYEVQSPELCGKEGCFAPAVLRDYAVDTLRVTHLFWTKFGTKKDTADAKYSWELGIRPAIQATQGRINTACPANYAEACSSR